MFGRLVAICLLSVSLSGCFRPPYNHFQQDKQTLKRTAFGTTFGATVGAIAGSVVSSVGAGAVIGGVSGAIIGYQYTRKPVIIKELQTQDIEYLQYGDTQTLIVPTDRYFYFNSANLNDLAYPGLNNIVRLLKLYPCAPIFVAGFTDDIGSDTQKKELSQAQAEAMLTFLWAHNIPAQKLRAQGYGDQHSIGSNQLIRGSAYNRRLEIQWITATSPQRKAAFSGMTK